jgi:uncharacterized cupredoxin-like copper-binding protein
MTMSPPSRTVLGLCLAGLLSAGLAGCGDDGAAEGAVGVELSEFAIDLDASAGEAGPITFEIENVGDALHEFVVVATDLDAGALPTGDDGAVDEDGEDMEIIDEVEDLAAGATAELTVDLEPGTYALICNLPGHYSQGMYSSFEVS